MRADCVVMGVGHAGLNTTAFKEAALKVRGAQTFKSYQTRALVVRL